MEPYDPQKEPLIMIHGLLSTPLAWAALSNDLWADATVRRRYQIWHFLYNTSAPALYASRQLRQQLRQVRQLLDPTGRHPALQRTTLLTHSMGGLVGKALALEPGDAFWRAAFTVPPEQLRLTPDERAQLNDAFDWRADPTIHRIIFIATPHRGSDFADNVIGRVGSWFTRPPDHFRTFYESVSARNPGVFTPEYAQLGRGRLDSVNALSPRQPTLRILAELPFAHPVQLHSIIGDRGRPGPLQQSSDGIVPYTSSHLDGVVSEKIVPAGHSAFRHPEAIQEIRRILSL
jgi:pimeloyl-ACP methyl ester carboxylesterase